MRLTLMLAVLIILSATLARAEGPMVRSLTPGAASPPATIEDIAWLSGRWVGEGLGGVAEESISPPLGGQMMGMFRLMKADGAPGFYEFYLFGERNGSLELRIKHFNPDITGWEEKDGYVSFPLVAIEENAVYFDGLTFALTGPDALASAVMIEGKGVAVFTYKRAQQ